jgi:membrane protein involved in colicin uptake
MSISILCNWSMGEDERKAKKARAAAAYRKAYPEKVKAQAAAYRKANLEKKKAQQSAWYKANAEKVKAQMAAYRKANPEKVRDYWAQSRATKNFFQLTAAAAVLGTIEGSKTMKTTN